MWRNIFSELRPGLLSSAADLDRAEVELGFRLPPSYRAFARECGTGRIDGRIRIATPAAESATDLVARSHLIAHSVAEAIDGLAENPLTRGEPHRFTVEGDADAALMERACFFGETENGSFLFWDVLPNVVEYEVWVLAPDLETIRFGGVDLFDFVRALQDPTDPCGLGMGTTPLPSYFEGNGSVELAQLDRGSSDDASS